MRTDKTTILVRIILLGLLVYTFPIIKAGALYTGKRVVAPAWKGAPALDLPRDAGVPKRNVLLVTVDTLRADHLSLYGYERHTSPHLERWFQGSEIYDRAYTPSAFTPASVVSMLSGVYPYEHGVRALWQRTPDHVVLLSDYLRASGWRAAAVIANPVLVDEATGFAQRFDSYDDRMGAVEGLDDGKSFTTPHGRERLAASNTDAAIRWLDEQERTSPHFLWVHYMDPHGPYTPPDDGPAQYDSDGFVPVERSKLRTYQVQAGVDNALDYVDRYDEEIAYTDQEIGRLLRHYDDLGYYDDAIVMFTVDHGEVMLERDTWHFEHSFHVWDGIMHIPLMVRRPGGQPGRIDVPVTSTDVAPSLLHWLGFQVPDYMHGKVLTERAQGDVLYMENGWPESEYAVLQGTKKWFASVSSRGWITDKWFVDLGEDPAEQTRGEWYGASPESVLRRRIRWDPDHGRKGISPTPDSTHSHGSGDAAADQEAILKALGYLD